MTIGGRNIVASTAENSSLFPRNWCLANTKPAIVLVKTMPSVVPTVMITEFRKLLANGTVSNTCRHASVLNSAGHHTGGRACSSDGVLKLETSIQNKGKSITKAMSRKTRYWRTSVTARLVFLVLVRVAAAVMCCPRLDRAAVSSRRRQPLQIGRAHVCTPV